MAIPQIYNEALQDLSQCANKESVAANMPTLSSLKSNIYREQRKQLLAPYATNTCMQRSL